jgi:penicillin-insensitive murein DD-endopeptidase
MGHSLCRAASALALASGVVLSAAAQDITAPGFRLPPLGPVTAATPAKELFGRKTTPAALTPRSIGFYAKGCLAGAKELPITGDNWQVMRLSRNRNWGNQALVAFVEKLASSVPKVSSWPGLLIGDMSQPRGGPMLSGHASHQIGLDVDIWLTPMPRHTLSSGERETMKATNVVRQDRLDVDGDWTPDSMAVVKLAAQDPQVERVFVNAAIKKAICRDAKGDRAWLDKVRPIYGHDYHFHVRLACPPGETACERQAPPPGNDGCGKELDHWFSDAVLHPKPPRVPVKPRPPLTLAQLPSPCREVLAAP